MDASSSSVAVCVQLMTTRGSGDCCAYKKRTRVKRQLLIVGRVEGLRSRLVTRISSFRTLGMTPSTLVPHLPLPFTDFNLRHLFASRYIASRTGDRPKLLHCGIAFVRNQAQCHSLHVFQTPSLINFNLTHYQEQRPELASVQNTHAIIHNRMVAPRSLVLSTSTCQKAPPGHW